MACGLLQMHMWFWVPWRDHTTLMQFPLYWAPSLPALMLRRPHSRRRPPSDQHECHGALWSSAKVTGQHLGEASDDVISISYHLSPDFFHYGAGHWLWRTVRMPGLWKALYGAVERTGDSVSPIECYSHWEMDLKVPVKAVSTLNDWLCVREPG